MSEKMKIGKYRVLDKIGEGGMGKIFKALHPTLRRPIIIKQLRITSQKALAQRFKREARIMIDFRNENIVQVYDHFREGSSYYIAMEYVDGVTLENLIKKKKQISPMASILILYEVAKGLKYAHDKGVVHRDIKPDNVLISKAGEVKLVDFGIATAREEKEEDLTKTGAVMGTPAYMSPEQLTSAKTVDKRSDIYSLGVLFYKVVTGVKPFPSNFSADTIKNITKGHYDRPEKINPAIPALFKRIIRKTMNHKIKRRYKDLKYLLKLLSPYVSRFKDQREMNRAIRNYILEDSKSSESLLASMAVKKKRNPLFLLAAAAVVAALVLASGFLFYSWGFYHDFFQDKAYGGLEIRAFVPKNYYKDTRFIYGVAELLKVDSKNEEAKTFMLHPQSFPIALPFLKQEKLNKKWKDMLSTGTIFLPAGNYELNLILENQKILKAFYLNPRRIQRQSLQTEKRRLFEFSVDQPPVQPIGIKHAIYDSVTGKSIYAQTNIWIKDGRVWKNWKSEWKRLDKITSGRNYIFKYEAPGYYEKQIILYVERDVENLELDIGLVQYPGKLVLKSNFTEGEILIDNRSENYIGGDRKEFVTYGYTVDGKKEFPLPEGNYTLTVRMGAAAEQQSYQFKIIQKRTTVLDISFDNKKNTIIISPGK
ncbi:MAG: serine/threonine protein kinase [Spirochaetales bacterium]|nr:serine/threonine protein kinase [Spirochaetales bacterium]